MTAEITSTSQLPKLRMSDDDDMRAIAEAKVEFPELCGHGIGNGGFAGAELCPIDPGDVHIARIWLRRQPRIKNPNPGTDTSYGLKHDVEYDMGASISNGAFIVAALAEGFKIRRCGRRSPNAYISISSRRVSEGCWHIGIQKPRGWLAKHLQSEEASS